MKRKNYSIVSAAAILALIATGCSSTSAPTPVVTAENTTTVTTEPKTKEESEEPVSISEEPKEGNDTLEEVSPLDAKTIKHLTAMIDDIAQNKKGNIILSGTSLDMAMGMAYQGASDGAEAALNEYYGADKAVKAEHDKALLDAYSHYSFVDLFVSNAIYTNKGLELFPEFSETLAQSYKAEAKTLDFMDVNSADIINQYCADHTDNMIKEIISPEALKEQQSVILNALYFNAEWEDAFTEDMVHDTEFHNLTGDISKVTGMYDNDLSYYYSNDNACAFEKFYKGEEISFIGILPDESILKEGQDFDISDIDIDDLLSNKVFGDTNIMLPKFKVEDDNSLSDSLKAQGLESIFAGGGFKNMSARDLYVSDIMQKVIVDVDENGTKAAAITSIMMTDGMAAVPDPPKNIILDRPFAFMIYDTVNKEPLFIGKITSL